MRNGKYVVSGYHIRKLANGVPGRVNISLDLGLTASEVTIGDGRVLLPDARNWTLTC